MKVNGEEFLKNVSIEQDKAVLQERQDILHSQKIDSTQKEPTYFDEEIDLSIHNTQKNSDDIDPNIGLENVVLTQNDSPDKKKKFIMLGFGVIILFIAILVTMRIINNKEKENTLKELEPKQTEVKQEKLLDNIKPDIQTLQPKKQVVEKNLEKKLDIEAPIIEEPVIKKKPKIVLPEPTKEDKLPIKIEKPKENEKKVKDLFGLEPKTQKETKKKTVKKYKEKTVKKENKKPKPIIYNEPKRKIVVPPPTEINLDKKNKTKLKGYFVQIAALTKHPSRKFLINITKKGYSYKIYSITIKGKKFNKVLIGPYPSKKVALKHRATIRKVFKNPGAYILKF